MDELQKDTRLLRRNLAKGFVSKETVDKMLQDLPDVEDRAEWVDPEAEEEQDASESGDEAAAEAE